MTYEDERQFYQANVIGLRALTMKIIQTTQVVRREYQIE